MFVLYTLVVYDLDHESWPCATFAESFSTMTNVRKAELKPANQNPWYCLATIYGEASGPPDDELVSKNRAAWNRFVASALSADARAELLKSGFSAREIAVLSTEEESALGRAFSARTGRQGEFLPAADGCPDFTFTQFERELDFSGFLFPKGANFGWASFKKPVDFSSAIFFEHVDFGSATFGEAASFCAATFGGDAFFGSVIFTENANFGSATFSQSSNFGSATFFRIANFDSARFSQRANFGWSTFDIGNFGATTFSDETSFCSATFSHGVNFASTMFIGLSDFRSAIFRASGCFRAATFSSDTDFVSSRFIKGADFRLAKFLRTISFVNTTFADSTTFAGTDFVTHVPDFRGAAMHELTDYCDALWPKPCRDRASAVIQVDAYEHLKREMNRLKRRAEEHNFHCRGLRARRGLERFWSGAWLLNYLYEALSNYGQSVGRPLFSIIISFGIGCLIFARIPIGNGTHLTRTAAATLSFENIFSVFFIRFRLSAPETTNDISNLAHVLCTVQSLLGGLLLFFLGLALCNRFSMK
jgi:hypothetical protein